MEVAVLVEAAVVTGVSVTREENLGRVVVEWGEVVQLEAAEVARARAGVEAVAAEVAAVGLAVGVVGA